MLMTISTGNTDGIDRCSDPNAVLTRVRIPAGRPNVGHPVQLDESEGRIGQVVDSTHDPADLPGLVIHPHLQPRSDAQFR